MSREAWMPGATYTLVNEYLQCPSKKYLEGMSSFLTPN